MIRLRQGQAGGPKCADRGLLYKYILLQPRYFNDVGEKVSV